MKKHFAFVCLAYMAFGAGIGIKVFKSNPWIDGNWSAGIFAFCAIIFVVAMSISMPKLQGYIEDFEKPKIK